MQLLLLVALVPLCHGESLYLEWNPNGESDLAGYKVYYGTASGSYGNPIVVGNVTTYELTGLDAGVRYYVSITAYDTSDNESEKSDEENGVPDDTEIPTITITIPTTSSTYSTDTATMSLSGSASDNVGVTEVSWDNDRGGAGSASGTSSWSASSISLQEGINIITVTAQDASSNTGTDTLTVTYSPDMTKLQYNSADPPVILTGPVPEEGFITINVPDNLGNAISATLLLTLWDADIAGEGFMYINGNPAIDLPVGPYNDLEHDFDVSIDPAQIITGDNIIRFTHVATAGYEVRSAAIQITFTSYQDTVEPEITITSPTQSSTYTTSNSSITLSGNASDNQGVTQVSWVNSRGGSGTASGTASWSTTGINLQSGNNNITVTATDAAGNTGTDSIVVQYNVSTTSTTSSIITTTTTAVSTTTTIPTTTTSVATSTTTTVPSTTSSVASTTTTVPPTTSTTVPTTTAPVTTTSIVVPTTIPTTTTTVPSGSTAISGSIMINNGDEVTTSREVTLTLYASVEVPQLASASFAGEELGPDAIMCISNDGKQWSSFESYKQTKQWTLEPGNGLKSVYAGFRDGDGNWISEPVQDHIILDEAQTTCDNPQKLQPLSVTASSTSPRYSADNLIDGDPSTIWSSVVSLFKKDEYITLDLGTIKKVSELTMYASRLFGVDFFPTSFKIQVSQDNSTWLDINTVQGFVFGQSLTSGSWNTNGLECRYIRIYITQSKALFLLFKLAQIAEIEVYGCDTSGALPLLAEESAFTESHTHETVTDKRDSSRKTENQNTIPSTPGTPTVTFLE
jgi:hypothetical protein